MKRTLLAFLWLLLIVSVSFTQNPPSEGQMKALPTIAQKTERMQSYSGFFTDYWDAREGKLWLRIDKDKWNTPFLFHESLPNGVGSNDLGLDRGQPGRTFVVHFERSGPRVLLVAENQEYRAVTDDLEQQRAVREAFAQSILWGFKVEAVDGDAVLVDATDFFLSDAHQVAARLAEGKPGRFRVDLSRSAIYLPRTRNFPENTDVESTLTLVGDEPGQFVRAVTPDPRAVTVHEHFCFIQAPPPGFHSRPFDPRAGYFGISYMDFASPVDVPIVQRYIARHRLARKDVSAAVRAGQADRLLRGPRHPRADPLGCARGRWMVEPGVHGRGLQGCLSGPAAAGRRRSHGHPLQRDRMGAALHARMVDWRCCRRSSHRGNHQTVM